MNLNQVKIYFYVRPSSVKGKRGCLYVRITINNKQIVCAVKSLAMYPEEFDVKTQNPKKKCDLFFECHNFMIGIRKEVNRIHNDYENKHRILTKQDLEKAIEDVYYVVKYGKTNTYKSFLDVYKVMMAEEEAMIGKTLSKGTHEVRERYYKVFFSCFIDLDYRNIPIGNFTEEHTEKVKKWLISKYALGTCGRIYPMFKLTFEFALKKKWVIVSPCATVDSIKYPSAPNLVWLEKEEVEKLEKLRLDGKAKKMRDAFLFCCHTGLSIGDYQLMNPKKSRRLIIEAQSPRDIVPPEIITMNYGSFIVGNRRKTGTMYRIPVTPQISKIISEYGGIDNLPYSVHNCGETLGYLTKMAGIKKKIRFHTARKTMANYLLNTKKMNPYLVKDIMGWRKIEEADQYTQISNETLAHAVFNTNQ